MVAIHCNGLFYGVYQFRDVKQGDVLDLDRMFDLRGYYRVMHVCEDSGASRPARKLNIYVLPNT